MNAPGAVGTEPSSERLHGRMLFGVGHGWNMEIRGLFWNLAKTASHESVIGMIGSCRANLVMLAEHGHLNIKQLSERYREKLGISFLPPETPLEGVEPPKISALIHAEVGRLKEHFRDDYGRLTIHRLQIRGHPDMLVALIHGHDRRNWNVADQTGWVPMIMNDIIRMEQRRNCDRTIVVGDFNMNPFDPPMTHAMGFNAVMTRSIARRKERTVDGKAYPFFYNPMWGHFGDRTKGPPGTYYHAGSNPTNHYWHMLDQILIRPSLLDEFVDVDILEESEKEKLSVGRHERPDENVSDHFPIFFQLRIKPAKGRSS